MKSIFTYIVAITFFIPCIYGSQDLDHESDFQRIPYYEETTDVNSKYLAPIIEGTQLIKNHPIRWVLTHEFIELGNQSWNKLPVYQRTYCKIMWEQLSDFAIESRHHSIKHQAQRIMQDAQQYLENIEPAKFEKQI